MADDELQMEDLEVVDTTSPDTIEPEQDNAADEESLLDLMYGDMEVVDQVTADQIQEEDAQENEYELGEEFIEINEDMVEIDDINSKQEPGLEAHVDTAPCNVDGGDGDDEAKDKAADDSGKDASTPTEVAVMEVQEADKPVPETEFQLVDKTDSPADVNTADTAEDIAEESDVLQVEDPQNDLDADLLTSQKEQASSSVSADQEGEKALDSSEMDAADGDKKPSSEQESNAVKCATSSQENKTVSSSNKTTSCNDKEGKKEDTTKSQSDSKSSKQSESKTSGKVESTSRNLWVSGLPSTTKAADLKTLFSKHGKVMVTKVLASSKVCGAKCYGFVTMSTSKEATDSAQHLNATKMHGKHVIQVTKKEPKKNGAKKPDEKAADKKTESGDKKDSNKRKITERRSYRPRSTHDSARRDSGDNRQLFSPPSSDGDRNRSHGNTHRDTRTSSHRVSSSHRSHTSHQSSSRSGHQSRSSDSKSRAPSRRSSGTHSSSKDHRPSSSSDKAHKSPAKKESDKKASSMKPEKKEKPEASSTTEKSEGADPVEGTIADSTEAGGKEDSISDEAKIVVDAVGEDTETKTGDGNDDSEAKTSEKDIVPFNQMKEEKMKEWEKLKKRKSLQEDLKRKEIYQEKKRQKDIHIRQRMESLKLTREREKLRRERQRLERERLAAQRREFLRLEQLERDKLDRERTERLRLERLRLEEERDRRTLKRMFERSIEDEWLDNKRSLMSDSFQRDRFRDIDSRDLRPTRYDDARLDRDAYDNRRVERYNKKDFGRPDFRDREASRSSLRDDRNDDRFDRLSDRNRDGVRARDGDAGRYRDGDRGRDMDRRPLRNTFDSRGERKMDRGVVPASRNAAHQPSHWGSGSQSASALSAGLGTSAYMTSMQQPGMMGGQRVLAGQHAALPINSHIGMNHNIRRY